MVHPFYQQTVSRNAVLPVQVYNLSFVASLSGVEFLPLVEQSLSPLGVLALDLPEEIGQFPVAFLASLTYLAYTFPGRLVWRALLRSQRASFIPVI